MIEPNPDWQQILLDLRRHYKTFPKLAAAIDYVVTDKWLGEASRNPIKDIRYSTGVRLVALHEKHCKKTPGDLA